MTAVVTTEDDQIYFEYLTAMPVIFLGYLILSKVEMNPCFS